MTTPTINRAQLIALDWGSTGFRAFLMAQDGQIMDTRSADLGASVMNGAPAYAAALQDLCGDWMLAQPDLKILACGMVGSKHGWQEVPYASCPADAAQLARATGKVPDYPVQIVPGVLYQPESSAPDVMRGEETQVQGALHLHPELARRSCLVLPGTHSKWVDVEDQQIMRFATHMTGELFAVLREYSVLKRLMPDPLAPRQPVDLQIFLEAVGAVRRDGHGALTHQLFSVRTLGLMESLSANQLPDYLSGLLIGTEIKAGLHWRSIAGLNTAPLALIGQADLCTLYKQAILHFDHQVDFSMNNTAPHGLWSLAQASGMIPASQLPTAL